MRMVLCLTFLLSVYVYLYLYETKLCLVMLFDMKLLDNVLIRPTVRTVACGFIAITVVLQRSPHSLLQLESNQPSKQL